MTKRQKQIKERERLEESLLNSRKRGVMPESYNFNHTNKLIIYDKPKKR